jgi:hypothetical protein
MNNLVEFLRIQLDEDERRIAEHPDGVDWEDDLLATQESNYPCTEILIIGKRRALREVETKRRLLLQFELRGDSVRRTVVPSSGGVWDDLLRMLAMPYANRPGYREEWRP